MRAAKKWYLSFVEEAILNKDYEGFIGGRVEATGTGSDYPDEEIRFFTNKLSDWYRLRDQYDLCEVGAKDLERLRRELRGHQMRVD
jgi:hypothetical protein